MAIMKCPNPNCTFQFDSAQVPPGAVLACPQCGLQFTLGPAPAAAAPPAPAYAAAPQPPYGAPAAPAGYPGYAPAAPVGYPGYGTPPGYGAAAGTDLGSAPGPDVVGMAEEDLAVGGTVRTPARRSGGFGGTILALGGVILLVAVAVGVVVVSMVARRGQLPRGGGGANEFQKADLNFAFGKPGEGWAPDPATQNALGVNAFAFKKGEGDAWIAFSAKDYKDQDVRPSEVKERVLEHLNKAFDNLPPELPPEPVEWAGHKAEKYTFRAVYKPTGEPCEGEAYTLGYKGVAYWYYSWAPEKSAADRAEELTALRNGFRTLDMREKWEPTKLSERVLRSKAGLYKLIDYGQVWAEPKSKDPADEDPKADLIRTGTLKNQGRGDFRPTAELVVMVIDGGADPLDAGKSYVEKRYQAFAKIRGDAITFADLTGDPEGDPPVGPETSDAPVARVKLTVGGADAFRSADKLIVISAVAAEGKVVVAEASCPWKERAVWERRLMQLLGSLKAK